MKKGIIKSIIMSALLMCGLMSMNFPAQAVAFQTMTELNENGGAVSGDFYTISTATELNYFSEYVNAGNITSGVTFVLINDINLNEGVDFTFDDDTGLVRVSKVGETTYWLGTGFKGDVSGDNTTFDDIASYKGRIYLSSTNAEGTIDSIDYLNVWAPAGSSKELYFKGTLKGNGHTISGLYINNSKQRQGLIGYMKSGTVKSLGIKNSYIKAADGVGSFVAVGYYHCTIEDCYNEATVICGGLTGGIAGNFYRDCTIKNCYNAGY